MNTMSASAATSVAEDTRTRGHEDARVEDVAARDLGVLDLGVRQLTVVVVIAAELDRDATTRAGLGGRQAGQQHLVADVVGVGDLLGVEHAVAVDVEAGLDRRAAVAAMRAGGLGREARHRAARLVRGQLSIGAERVEPDASRPDVQTEWPTRRDPWVWARRSSPWWRVADRRQCSVCDDGADLWCPDHRRCARARAPRVRRAAPRGSNSGSRCCRSRRARRESCSEAA